MTKIRYEKGAPGDPFGTKVAVSDEHPGVRGVGQTVGDAREDLRAKLAKKTRQPIEFVEEPGSHFAEHAEREKKSRKP